MTRTIHLITAKSTSYSSETIIVAAFASKHEADDVMAMIERCQPGKRLEVVPVELRGEFGEVFIPSIFHDPPMQPLTFEFTNEGESA